MKEPSLKEILLNHINQTQGWVAKGSMYALGEEEGFSPEYVGRELRLLAEEGLISVSYYKSKRNIDLARYARLDTPQPIKQKPKVEIININGQMIAKMI